MILEEYSRKIIFQMTWCSWDECAYYYRTLSDELYVLQYNRHFFNGTAER